MARLYIYYNPTTAKKDKLAKKASIKGSSIPNLTLAAFCTWISVYTSTLGLPNMYININLQKTTKFILKFFIEDQQYS